MDQEMSSVVAVAWNRNSCISRFGSKAAVSGIKCDCEMVRGGNIGKDGCRMIIFMVDGV
jgi:hypothetical protein